MITLTIAHVQAKFVTPNSLQIEGLAESMQFYSESTPLPLLHVQCFSAVSTPMMLTHRLSAGYTAHCFISASSGKFFVPLI